MKPWPFTPDMKRAAEVFWHLSNEWGSNSFAFQHLEPPERMYQPDSIELGSLQHAWWLFFTGWLSRQGYSAMQVFTGARAIFSRHGTKLIDPEMVGKLPVAAYDDIKKITPYGVVEPHRVEGWWRNSLAMLRDHYASDPRQLMLTLNLNRLLMDVRADLVKRFEKFPGIGQKIAQLTIGWFQEADWPHDQELWTRLRRVPVIAIDLWWMRMVYQFGLIQQYEIDVTTQISRPIAEFVCQVCLEAGINHNHLAQAVWHLGKEYCAKARIRSRSNHGSYRQICIQCPALAFCQGIVPANSHDENGKKVVHPEIGWDMFMPHPSKAVVNKMLEF